MNKNSKTQLGFTHMMIIVVILAIALIGALGFVFWQNFMQPKTSDAVKNNTSNTSNKSDTTTDKTASTDAIVDKTSSVDYLALDDWGVKFKLPTATNDTITYYKTDDSTYGFSTKNVEALGGSCVSPGTDGHVQYLFSFYRQTSPQSDSGASGGILSGKIGNYYYYMIKSQAPCTDKSDTASLNTEKAALDLLQNTLSTVLEK